MSDYFSSFVVEPVVRQARRLSRLSSGEKSPQFLPVVPKILRTWDPTRLWNSSPPISGNEDEENKVKACRAWAYSTSSSSLKGMESGENGSPDREQDDGAATIPFPPLQPRITQQPRPAGSVEGRAHSETSINPLHELPDRSRMHEEDIRGHSQSDPVTSLSGESSTNNGASSVALARAYYENDGQSCSRDGSGTLPADDGNGPLRQKIKSIWQGDGSIEEKSQLLQTLMMEPYNSSRRSLQGFSNPSKAVAPFCRSRTSSSSKDNHGSASGSSMSAEDLADEARHFNLSPSDMTTTYAPPDQEDPPSDAPESQTETQARQLGCMHYKRNVKLQCFTCKRWYTCRLCHDDAEDHVLPRRETKNMMCMICKSPQQASQTCKTCGEQASCYYCSVCKLWNNDPAKSIYHCDDCGICRLGEGLGKDFFHCRTCAVCMSIEVQSRHRCIERSTKCDCPICGEYLFTSAGTVVFMRCGHSIHEVCFNEWCRASYKCPICSKSIVNMESQFRSLDRQIKAQPMPSEYGNTIAYVYCNDCSAKCMTKYHWLGLKCECCESYNTQQHYLLNTDKAGSDVQSHHDAAGRTTASPPLPQNVSDEAVAIPNPRATWRRPSITVSEIRRSNDSPLPLPQTRGDRSASPAAGNYFGTGLRREEPTHSPGAARKEPEYDFWGRPIYPRKRPKRSSSEDSTTGSGDEDEDEDEEEEEDEESFSDDDDDGMEDDGLEDDDDDDIDQLALIGHR